MFRTFLQNTLRILSKLILMRYKPEVIAITGSVGKTSTKEACFCVLSQKFRVRKTEKNFNTEIGVQLTIIGVSNEPGKSLLKWLTVFVKAVKIILIKSKTYPEKLILELAADKPGDISFFLSFLRPQIGIITTISKVHLENFKSFQQIIAEKRQVVECLPAKGYAILNFDDPKVADMAEKTEANIVPFGLKSSQVAVQAQDAKVIVKNNDLGIYFKLLHKNTAIPVFIKGAAAYHLLYSFLAAVSLGLVYNITALDIAGGLEQYTPLPGRFAVKNKKGVFVIDDAYNAAPASTCAAIESLVALPVGKRKIAVLAGMLELGSWEEKGHKKVGKCAANSKIDMLVTYGQSAKIISKTAKMPKDRARHFYSQKELITFLRSYIKAGDAILVKGSHGMRMDLVVKALLRTNK